MRQMHRSGHLHDYLSFLSVVLLCSACLLSCSIAKPVPGVVTADGYAAELWAEDLPLVRSLVYDAQSGNVLALVRGRSQVVALKEDSTTGQVRQTVLLESEDELTHGLAVHGGYIYASAANTVYRWPYNPSATGPSNSEPEVVVTRMGNVGPSDTAAGHITRTLATNGSDYMYISVGSNWNVDPNAFRSRIRRINLSEPIPLGGHDFTQAEVFADGLRNEVGLAFDPQGRLWGVDNGPDRLQRGDLGEDIFQNNPAEELNLFDGPPGTFYGYPWCFTTYWLPARGNARNMQYLRQFAWPEDEPSNHPDYKQLYSDLWCQDANNNRPPVMGLPSHVAPLGIQFWDGKGCENAGAFDCSMTGDAFIALHGSWNRDVPDGFGVVQIEFNDMGMPTYPHTQAMTKLVWQEDYQTNCISNQTTQTVPSTCFRPVNAIFLPSGQMLVSSDTTGTIVRVSTNKPVTPPLPRPPTPPSAPPMQQGAPGGGPDDVSTAGLSPPPALSPPPPTPPAGNRSGAASGAAALGGSGVVGWVAGLGLAVGLGLGSAYGG